MNSNIFIAPSHLTSLEPQHPGYCSLYITPIEHVQTWPSINPQNGCIASYPALYTGKIWYTIENMPENAVYREEDQESPAGTWVNHTVTAPLADDSVLQNLSTLALRFRRFAVIVKEQNGMLRLLGGPNAGAIIKQTYSSAADEGTRQRILTITWENDNPALNISTQSIPVTSINISFMLVEEFKVAPGAPMEDGESSYTNINLSATVRPVVFIDGMRLPTIAGNGRHYTYDFVTRIITIVPAVYNNEIIGIYN